MSVHQFRREDLLRPATPGIAAFYDSQMEQAALAAVEHAAIGELTPVVFTKAWDLDHDLTAFARLIRLTERSPKTARTYALEAEVFVRYLRQRHGKSLAEAAEPDFWAYRAFRREGPLNIRLSPASWNKVAAVLLRLIRHRKLPCPDIEWRKFRVRKPRTKSDQSRSPRISCSVIKGWLWAALACATKLSRNCLSPRDCAAPRIA